MRSCGAATHPPPCARICAFARTRTRARLSHSHPAHHSSSRHPPACRREAQAERTLAASANHYSKIHACVFIIQAFRFLVLLFNAHQDETGGDHAPELTHAKIGKWEYLRTPDATPEGILRNSFLQRFAKDTRKPRDIEEMKRRVNTAKADMPEIREVRGCMSVSCLQLHCHKP